MLAPGRSRCGLVYGCTDRCEDRCTEGGAPGSGDFGVVEVSCQKDQNVTGCVINRLKCLNRHLVRLPGLSNTGSLVPKFCRN